MKRFIIELFSETGKISSMRFIYIITTITACFLSVYLIFFHYDKLSWEVITLITSLLANGTTGKVLQKKSELEKREKEV